MSRFDLTSPASYVARVRSVEDDGYRFYIEYRNGLVVPVNSSGPVDFEVGSVVLVSPDSTRIEPAPDELWPEESWVGVVRLISDDITVVDANGRWRMLRTPSDLTYQVGNTVEARDSYGIVRVLSEAPIKYIDLPAVDDTVIEKFKTQEGAKRLTFEDFGGLHHVVERARELVEIPLTHKDRLSKIGARPIKGILFTEHPGTGKTMLARIIASNTESVFYEISGPEIFSKWYGQSEEILRKLFEHAGKQKSAIIFFDEIDSVAGKRDDESHEASRRVVAQLLTLMDGFTSKDNVIVIAATNRPQDIDAALRRPGRFDWEVNFPLPDVNDREAILRATARNLSAATNLPHAWVAQHTDSWWPAELAAIWSEAALLAAVDEREVIITEDYIGGFERVLAQRRRAGLAPPGGNSS